MINSYLAAILLMTQALFAWQIQDFAYDKDWPYQDLWLNEEAVFKGYGPDCAARYETLRPLLHQFDRPFTVLEIGANNGYFSLRITKDYDATCVMVDITDRLKRICEANSSLKHIIYLQKLLNTQDLEKLAQTEHFDLVLCFNVLHDIDRDTDWLAFFNALSKLGDHLVIETPPINDGFVTLKPRIAEIAQYLLKLPHGVQIGSFSRFSSKITDHMILFSNPQSDKKPKHNLPGISLATFNAFNGAYPNIHRREDPQNWQLTGHELHRIGP